jgi:ABC-type sugar transport system permease subunit/ABC-type glycerol-3-phosphate transport system substrate-binding protein
MHPTLKKAQHLICAAVLTLTTGVAFAAEKVTLRLSVWDGDKALETVRKLCRDFESLNPNIKVKLENYPDYNLYHQKMLITYAAGVAPDVVMMDPANFQALAVRKALLPLNSFFEQTPGFDIKEYYKEIVDAHSFKGVCYVLPRDIAPMGIIYYNKEMFRKKGIPMPDGSWTWSWKERPELKEKDFLWVCRQFQQKEGNKYTHWGYTSSWPQLLADQFAFSTGHLPYDNMEEPTKVMCGDPGYIKAFQFAADFSNKLHLAPSGSETSSAFAGATAQALFIQQKVAMYQVGIWEVPQMRRMLKPGTKEFFEWDIAPAPGFMDEKGNVTRRFTTGGSGYGIMASTKHRDAAWKLTRFLGGEPGMVAMAQAGIAQPAISKLARTPDVWLPGPNSPIEQQYPSSRIILDDLVKHVQFATTSRFGRVLQDRINKGLELMWNEQSTAEKVLTENQRLAQDQLNSLQEKENLSPFNWTYGVMIAVLILGAIVVWVYQPKKGQPKATQLERAEAKSAYSFLAPWILGFLLFTLVPMIGALLMSFADWDMILPARWRGVGNFVEVFTADPSLYKSLWVTTVYTVLSVPLGIFGSMMLALLLNQKVRGVQLFRTLYYIPSITSGVAASIIWLRVFNPETGLLNALLYGPAGEWPIGRWLSQWLMTDPNKPLDWLALESTALPALIIMSLWGIGGGTVIFLAGLQGIPQYYYEAATLDGAGIFGRFKAVTLPLLTPTIFFNLITGMVGAFQAFTQAYIMTLGGPNDATRFYVYHLFQAAFNSLRMGYASALGWVLFVIIMIITMIQFKASKWVYYEAEVK